MLDPRSIHVLEGFRAGVAAAFPVLAAWYFTNPLLMLAAMAALLSCLADPGGPVARRLPSLLGFGACGSLLMLAMPLLHGLGLAPLLAAAVPLLFVFSMARVWGQPAQVLGDLLSVVLLLAAGRDRGAAEAVDAALVFAGGALFATLLTIAIWRILPHAPVRRATADVYAALSEYTRTLLLFAELPREGRRADDMPSWHGRARVRGVIEVARRMIDQTQGSSGVAPVEIARNVMRLAAAEQIFAALVALSDALENPAPATRQAAALSLRRLRPLLRVIANAIDTDSLARLPRIERAIAQAVTDAAHCAVLRPIAHAIGERLRLAVVSRDFAAPEPALAGGKARPAWYSGAGRRRLALPFTANLVWQSAIFRHAARIALVSSIAVWATLYYKIPHGYWLTITLVLVMQPYFAHTIGRSVARMGGTLAGGGMAAALTLMMPSHMHVAGFLPLLGALALAVRQVNYSLYIAIYTPLVIILTERLQQGADPLQVARDRAGLTILAGVIAILANALIWPVWEPDQAERDMRRAIAAHAAFARAVLGGDGDIEAGRRAAGLACNNLEASIERAAREPRRGQRARVADLRMADATLRRIAGKLVAWSFDAPGRENLAHCAQARWVQQALTDLAAQKTPPVRPQDNAAHESLSRMAGQVEMLIASGGQGSALDKLGLGAPDPH
jgi:uncharacterized membrane protein YccC